MKNTIEAIKFIFSNEDADIEPIAVLGSIEDEKFIQMLWIFIYAAGCR